MLKISYYFMDLNEQVPDCIKSLPTSVVANNLDVLSGLI